ncbi:CBS domain-containing protein [Patulibacter defluvii]|uniref:CBS domain-containing protein n=1 Tax=Patulibacter defluvii TaxID=3095358 RepID=UPI0035C8EEEB
MLVRDAMSPKVVEVGPAHTLRQAAEQMTAAKVGSAVVSDPDGAGPGIVTERDVLIAVARGLDLDQVLVGDHVGSSVVFAAPDWSLDDAADAMARGRFRHLVVLDGARIVGVVSVRDIIHAWANERIERGAVEHHAAADVIGTA